MVQLLVKGGATVDSYDMYKCTPLHSAAREGAIDSVKALIELGANVNAAGEDGYTPLAFSIFEQNRVPPVPAHKEIEIILRQHGATE